LDWNSVSQQRGSGELPSCATNAWTHRLTLATSLIITESSLTIFSEAAWRTGTGEATGYTQRTDSASVCREFDHSVSFPDHPCPVLLNGNLQFPFLLVRKQSNLGIRSHVIWQPTDGRVCSEGRQEFEKSICNGLHLPREFVKNKDRTATSTSGMPSIGITQTDDNRRKNHGERTGCGCGRGEEAAEKQNRIRALELSFTFTGTWGIALMAMAGFS
jgi:hypothetical protein